MNEMTSVKKSIICAVCIALCYVLPLFFHGIQNAGPVFCPMHIPGRSGFGDDTRGISERNSSAGEDFNPPVRVGNHFTDRIRCEKDVRFLPAG